MQHLRKSTCLLVSSLFHEKEITGFLLTLFQKYVTETNCNKKIPPKSGIFDFLHPGKGVESYELD
jgi:hypothetical protein